MCVFTCIVKRGSVRFLKNYGIIRCAREIAHYLLDLIQDPIRRQIFFQIEFKNVLRLIENSNENSYIRICACIGQHSFYNAKNKATRKKIGCTSMADFRPKSGR